MHCWKVFQCKGERVFKSFLLKHVEQSRLKKEHHASRGCSNVQNIKGPNQVERHKARTVGTPIHTEMTNMLFSYRVQ